MNNYMKIYEQRVGRDGRTYTMAAVPGGWCVYSEGYDANVDGQTREFELDLGTYHEAEQFFQTLTA